MAWMVGLVASSRPRIGFSDLGKKMGLWVLTKGCRCRMCGSEGGRGSVSVEMGL